MTDRDPIKALAEESAEGDQTEPDAFAALQDELERARDTHREERFIWVVVVLLVVDMATFGSMETWAAPVSILALQIIGLMVFAKRCGVEDVHQIMDKILATKPLNAKHKDD